MALQITSNVTQLLPDIFSGSSHEHHLQKRQAGGAAVATGVLALATIAMITEFIVYSGFTPKVRSNSPCFVFVITLILTFLYYNIKHENFITIKFMDIIYEMQNTFYIILQICLLQFIVQLFYLEKKYCERHLISNTKCFMHIFGR